MMLITSTMLTPDVIAQLDQDLIIKVTPKMTDAGAAALQDICRQGLQGLQSRTVVVAVFEAMIRASPQYSKHLVCLMSGDFETFEKACQEPI
jgi:hypothetical protein